MSSGSTESTSNHEESLGAVFSFSATPSHALDVPDQRKSLLLNSPAPLEALEKDDSDTLTLSTVVAVTNKPADEVDDRLSSQEDRPEEEVETATLPALAAISNNGAARATSEEEETATLPSVTALGDELDAESTTEATLPKTALWTPVSVENKEALTTQKEEKAGQTLKTTVWSAIAKEEREEQATAHQTPVEGPLHTAVWPAASRTAPRPAAPTALHPSVSSTQNVVLTISRSRAILLTLLISFLNILLGVFIVLALLYQLNGTLIYQSPAPVQEVRAKVTQLEQQASQLANEVEELQERAAQVEAQQKAFEEATRQIETLQDEQNKVKKDLRQAEEYISTLQEENSQLEQEVTDVVERITLFETFLAGLQELLEEVRLYQARPLR